MSSPVKVFVFGATGQTGQQIIDGLVKSPTNFDITAVGRPSSMEKPENAEFKKRGVKVAGIDIENQRQQLAEHLKGADVVIVPVFFASLDQAKILIDVCKEVGVKRFVPNSFAPVMPGVGAMEMRERKEDVINYVKLQRIPFTVIDVAWWFQNLAFKIPSGRTDYTIVPPMDDPRIMGSGDQPIAFSDVHSIGPHVARIIVDPSTLNKYVHVWDEVLTSHQVVEALEELSGEKVERVYYTKEEMEKTLAEGRAVLAKNPTNEEAAGSVTCTEYFYSMAVRGDSVPEVADYLGYLDSRKLYPDLERRTVRDYYKDVLGGQAFVPYAADLQ